MYAGEIVERAGVDDLFATPQHPYTVGLLGSIPRLDRNTSHLATIEGMVPEHGAAAAGCRFAARCPFVGDSLPAARRRRWSRSAPATALALPQGAAGTAGVVMAALLEVEKSRQAFPRRALAVRAADGLRQGGRRRELPCRRRRDAGAGRRVRLRQIHLEPAGAAADRAGSRAASASRAATCSRSMPTRCAPSAGRRRSSSRTLMPRSTRA